MNDEEQVLEDLRAAVLRMRFPTLLAGSLLTLYALFSLAGTGFSLLGIGWVFTTSVKPMGALVLIASILMGALTTLVDIAAAGMLVVSGISGLQARVDPVHLVRSARFLKYFWWAALFRLMGTFGQILMQALLPLAMF